MGVHSKWGMSGQGIIFACPGSVNMNEYSVDSSNVQSEKGTAVHEMSEFSFSFGIPLKDLMGTKFNGVKVTKPMVDAAQEYIDVLDKFASIPTVLSKIEVKVGISSIDPKRLWGTGDYIGIDETMRNLYVGDYKNGYGIVEVYSDQFIYAVQSVKKGNVQCIGYALGVLDTYNLWDKMDHVVIFIVQPNKPHKDGIVRSHTYTITEMHEWKELYRATHELSLRPDAPRRAGSNCKYCGARGFCSTRITHTMETMKLNSDFAHCTPDQLIGIYQDADVMIKAIEGVKTKVEQLARQGHAVPNYKLVKGIARGVCEDEDGFIAEVIERGLDPALLYNKPKIKGKTVVKAIVGKVLADKYYAVPDVGLTLVPNSDPRVTYRADNIPDATGIFSSIN